MELPKERKDSKNLMEVKMQPTYGSFSKSDYVSTVVEHGESSQLLIAALTELAPVAGPLLALMVFSFFSDDITMWCVGHNGLVQAACIWSKPPTRVFACWGLVLGSCLMCWRLTHERVFYVLMRHRIMVNFDDSVLGYCMMLFLLALYFLSLFHFILMMLYDHPHHDPKLKFFNTDLSLLWRDPEKFNEKNPEAITFVMLVVTKFLAPGGVCLGFLLGYDQLEERLLSLIKYVEEDPNKSHQLLAETVFVPENVMRELFSSSEFKLKLQREWTIEDLCEHISEMALKYEGVKLIGKPVDVSMVSPRLRTQTATDITVFKAVQQAFTFDWWPVKFLLDVDLIDPDSIQFKKFASISFLFTFIMSLAGVLRVVWRWYNLGKYLRAGTMSAHGVACDLIPLLASLFCFMVVLRESWEYTPCGRRSRSSEYASRASGAKLRKGKVKTKLKALAALAQGP